MTFLGFLLALDSDLLGISYLHLIVTNLGFLLALDSDLLGLLDSWGMRFTPYNLSRALAWGILVWLYNLSHKILHSIVTDLGFPS